MSHSIADIARATGLACAGDETVRIARLAEPGEAGPQDLAIAIDPRYEAAIRTGSARAAVLRAGTDWRGLGLSAALFAPGPRDALAALGEVFAPTPDLAPGIDSLAHVNGTAVLGQDVWIGPFAMIGPGARVGEGARIMAHVTIGAGAEIGPRALLHPGVRIGAAVRIGAQFIAQPNAVIGADGFSFVTRRRRPSADPAPNMPPRRINSLGTVTIGDNVEIGAGTTIDRGTIADTRIGSGTKIDNLVQIGHNVRIGECCILCGQSGIAGSAELGDRVVLGGKSGIGDHASIGADSLIGGGTLVHGSIVAGSVLLGTPAAPRMQFWRQVIALRQLPKALEDIKAMKKRLGL